jgi:hypothetical protein
MNNFNQYFQEKIGKKSVIDFGKAKFPGEPEGNRNEWEILRTGSKKIVIVEVFEEKLKNELNEFSKFVQSKYLFITFFSLALSLLSTFISSDFKDISIIKSNYWETIYIVLIVIFFLGSIISAAYYGGKKKYSVPQLIERLKEE